MLVNFHSLFFQRAEEDRQPDEGAGGGGAGWQHLSVYGIPTHPGRFQIRHSGRRTRDEAKTAGH